MRAMWTGSISFGLVAIPVKAVPAQSPRDIRFEMVHEPCKSRLQTRRFCPQCQREVADEEVVRGYPFRKGEYVLFTEEELEATATPAKHTLRILDFVEMDEVDPIYFEKPYYLQPAPGGERTYALLHTAMRRNGRVGIGKVAFRSREQLALIRPLEHALVLETIAFPDEVRTVEEAVPPLPDAKLDDRELAMADTLIDSLTGAWEPAKYRDEYRDALSAQIEQKVEGGTVTRVTAAERPEKSQVVDLMEMLRQSVAAVQHDRGDERDAEATASADPKAGAEARVEEPPVPTTKREEVGRSPAGAPRRMRSSRKREVQKAA